MYTFSKALQTRLERELQQAATSGGNAIERALHSLQLVEKALWELKEFTVNYRFSDIVEEVRFFKEIKPAFTREQVFYDRLLFIESNRWESDKQQQKAYLAQVLESFGFYFKRNYPLYLYHRMGRSDLDNQLYVRGAKQAWFMPAGLPDLDSRFSNPFSLKLAKIQAYEQLSGHLSGLIDYLEKGTQPLTGDLFWSGTDSQFVELMMALHAKGSVNNGNLSLSHLADQLGGFLNFNARNLHQVTKNIRGRKKERTVFLQQLINSAEDKMDETDLNF